MLSTPISAAEIKKTVGENVVFVRTMSTLPDGQNLVDLIRKRS
jgi:hypothetical protein